MRAGLGMAIASSKQQLYGTGALAVDPAKLKCVLYKGLGDPGRAP
jgi:hypothetical protein